MKCESIDGSYDHMKCESIDGSYGIFQSPHCVWISSIDWCMVSVVGGRSGEQSPQPARWIGVFVAVDRSNDVGLYLGLNSP